MSPPLQAGTAVTGRVSFARDLARYAGQVALITREGQLSYRDLAARVDAMATRLGAEPRLVLLAATNTIDSIVVYLAALAAGHPVLLAPGDRPETVEALVTAFDPDVVASGSRLDERHAVAAHDPHPELALLLTTSGSTGSPKLVRLSAANLQANAESIASYLGLHPGDRAATTLPMHYCYGLSVVNSHLACGASLILTDGSVADRTFWELFREHHGTSFAGVPYTFDLLDRVGFEGMRLPSLRYVTQAGGRLAPERVRRYAALGRRDGWDFVVMYGQTEATARMGYLPPHLAEAHPTCVGVPIPGGTFRLEPRPEWPEPDTGELVYAGPNVMLGYAHRPADLALGRTVEELHTGDIARRTADGLYEIVGRTSRFAKVFGLRIDLDRVEAALAGHGLTAYCAGGDERLVVVVTAGGHDTGGRDAAPVARLAARAGGLPVRAVCVRLAADVPRLANGKPDYPAIASLDPAPAVRDATGDLRRLYVQILDRSDVTEDSTFVSLGGDSLSYVEMSVRLEQALGHLPADWHTTAIRDLRRAARPRAVRPSRGSTRTGEPAGRRWWARGSIDTSVALRAVAILLIVGTHARLFDVPGGAHLLLGVAGFNFARFRLGPTGNRERVLGIGRSVARIAIASVLWIAVAAVFLTDYYSVAQVFLVNYVAGTPRQFNDFWFIETLVYTLLVLLAVLAVRPVDRVERRYPFAVPVILVVLALVTRYHLIPGVWLPTPLVAFWLFALGWAAAKATTVRHRLLLTLAVGATVPGFHGDVAREAVMVGGLLLLVWLPTLASLPWLNRVAGVLAGSSLYIYLTHWQVLPRLTDHSTVLAVLAALAVGIGYAVAARRAAALLARVTRPPIP